MVSIPLLGHMRDSSALHMQKHPPDAKTPSRDRKTLQIQKDPPATGESEVSSNREIAKKDCDPRKSVEIPRVTIIKKY